MPYAWQCERCRQVVAPRGDQPPRFCPRCGQRLGGAPVEAPPAPAAGYRRTSGTATASLVLGLFSFLPGLGVPLGITAIALGSVADRRINRSHGLLGGGGLATAGIVLGFFGVLSQLAWCAGFR